MPEQLQAPLRDQSDVKIFILYLMEHIGRPLDFVEINDIVVQNGVVRPFDFCMAFPDLLKSGHIRALVSEDGEERYEITPLGTDAQDSLNGKILNVTKEKALQNAVLLLNMKKNNEGFRYDIEAAPGGGYRFVFSFSRDGKDVLSVSAATDSQKEAENMEAEFEHHPEIMRRAILSLLLNSARPLAEFDPLFLQ